MEDVFKQDMEIGIKVVSAFELGDKFCLIKLKKEKVLQNRYKLKETRSRKIDQQSYREKKKEI